MSRGVTIRDVVEVDDRVADAVHGIITDLVVGDAALAWSQPPTAGEIRALLEKVCAAARVGDGMLSLAYTGDQLSGLGYWLRYESPGHHPHARLENVAVAADVQRMGIGRRLACALVEGARAAGVEVLTLEIRGDNVTAQLLCRALGFRNYGRLPDFVVVGRRRYDRVFYMLDFRDDVR
jgi:ribosomal protein S18 acetylase RimI-like enzyme